MHLECKIKKKYHMYSIRQFYFLRKGLMKYNRVGVRVRVYKLIMHVGSLLIFARHAFMQSQFPFLLCPTPSHSTSRIFDLERF